jgi:hypothetical protein
LTREDASRPAGKSRRAVKEDIVMSEEQVTPVDAQPKAPKSAVDAAFDNATKWFVQRLTVAEKGLTVSARALERAAKALDELAVTLGNKRTALS